MDTELHRAVSQWLAEADPRPGKVWAEWEKHGVALLPLGRRFDAIRVTAERVHDAVGSDAPHTVATALETWLDGPVIRDLRSSSGPYYVLAAPGADWDGPAERLTTGTYLGVPRPGHATVLSRWVVLPQHPGALCDSRYLRALLATATPLRTVGR
ncbi:hypothetical protein [Streptomyces spectabilis]|uniref:DNA primase/polymerase bifunctional N-terminal domain-containing protein n=1 Tax=Streptomyces spectabilis TaxID=68270 RepID=A0A5P2XG22_STRST|nr:hypothetical protein [Streptomyces spectabilis]MBB5104404.1 hypothetical protein [Streptomyces spectabilis]MCI3905241.1 hypothetical protein [Streptomyces spectabilis]QEV62249.1 hypothetical protein CP982_28930 [Streptomyces spectabilis]GGU99759.1 hypothetical protein GCM10010245_02620 [Streptomyces spectabilis]